MSYFFFLKKKSKGEIIIVNRHYLPCTYYYWSVLLNSRLWLDGGGKIYSTIKMLLIINYVLLMCDIMYNSCETKSKTRYFALELGTNFQLFSLMYRKGKKRHSHTYIHEKKKPFSTNFFSFNDNKKHHILQVVIKYLNRATYIYLHISIFLCFLRKQKCAFVLEKRMIKKKNL